MRWAGSPARRSGWCGQAPVSFDAVEAEVNEGAQVDGCGAGVYPGVGGDGAAVAQAPVDSGDEPGDGAFDGWSPAAVFGLPVGVGGLAACVFEVVVVWPDAYLAAGFCSGERALSGQAAHRLLNPATRWSSRWRRPAVTVWPVGKVTVLAAVSMRKSAGAAVA